MRKRTKKYFNKVILIAFIITIVIISGLLYFLYSVGELTKTGIKNEFVFEQKNPGEFYSINPETGFITMFIGIFVLTFVLIFVFVLFLLMRHY